jgi:zinc protease
VASASAASLADRVFETTLSNGLKVLLVEEPKSPVVTIQIWYKVGSRNEPIGKTGISHMLEHMMFAGTPTLGPKQFSLTVQRNGGMANAFTTSDYTAYYEDFAADRVLFGLELEADRHPGRPIRGRLASVRGRRRSRRSALLRHRFQPSG